MMNSCELSPYNNFEGEITTSPGTGFGFFTMDTTEVKLMIDKDIKDLNTNMREKQIGGKIFICRMENHYGKQINILRLLILHFCLGAHLSLWMDSEKKPFISVDSIAAFVGERGTFTLFKWNISKKGKIIMLIGEGK